MKDKNFSLIVHGGAWDMPDEVVNAHNRGCKNAFFVAEKILSEGGSSLNAVENAVAVLEDDPTFDAGRGSHLNEDGFVQLDAGIMDGKDRSFGSVAALEGVRNPIILARRVQESEHILLVGDGAKRFATLNHIDTDNGEWLIVDRERELWKSLSQKEKVLASEFFLTPHAKGTVGAVAKDKDGNFAAATSTGGTPFKPVGRVGDSPICGSGFFADNSMGACSTTGWGEAIAKILLAYFAVISSDKTNAAELAINKLHSVGGAGGLILLNGKGIPSIHYNTRRMAYCYRDPISGEIVSGP